MTSPRLPNYNWSHPSLHELVAKQPPLTANDAILIDDLARRRCQCLLSVDDAHAALVETTKKLGVFNNTYWLISSDHGYNLGHHRIPSNKFLLYNHATRIPGVVRGPGIKPGPNPVLGTNVDYGPTFLAMAGIPTPPEMDGRSILSQLVPAGDADAEALLPAPTRLQLERERRELESRPWRDAQFHQYYNQGGPNPWSTQGCPDPGDPFVVGGPSCPKWGWSGSLGFKPLFPRDEGLTSTTRPLDDFSNTYIGLHSLDSSIGSGHYKYGEYQYQCSPAQILKKECFSDVQLYELFDLTTDPWELRNVYNETAPAIRDSLAKKLRTYYPCQGGACP